jgi:PAS domain S-box-containing protein
MVASAVSQGSKTSSFPRVGAPPMGAGTISERTMHLGAERTQHQGVASPFAAFGEIVDALAVPTAVLNTAGIVVACNQALLEQLHRPRPEVVGEPLLGWIARASERAAFGRAFMGMRPRLPGHRFTLEISLSPALGRPLPCLLRACKLASDNVLVTCEAELGERIPEMEMGRALTRGLEALDHGLLLLDGAGRIVHANPAARELFAGSPGHRHDGATLSTNLLGRSLLELADPEGARTLSQGMSQARAGNWHGELDLRRLDGELVAVELSLAAGRGDGAPMVALIRDLRERRLREFEARLAAQVDRLLASSLRPQESVAAACTAVMTGLGFARAALLARVGEGWERWQLRADHGPRFGPLGPELAPPPAWSTGATVIDVDPQDPQVRALLGDQDLNRPVLRVVLGAPARVVGHLLLRAAEPSSLDPQVHRLLATLAPQLALGLSNGLLMLETEALAGYQAMVLDQTTVLLDSLDADGRVITWNRASEQLLGITADQARGRRFGVEVAILQAPAIWSELWDTLRRTGQFVGEMSVLNHAGEAIPLHLEGRLLRDQRRDWSGTHSGDDPGLVIGAVLVGLDLRHRRALEDQILKAQKLAAVGLLAAGIAHEINNPLTGVVGYSKLLLERPNLDPKVREKVEKIAASGERCRKIVEGVLLFSRQQEGGKRRRVELRTLIDRVIGIGEYQWRMHNVRVLREGISDAAVLADPDQLEQVLLNLLSNAVDAMPRGGTIRLHLASDPDGRVRLEVSDEGIGIPPEIQGRIFDPFFSTKEIGKGTGLGLAISYGILKDHGGDILVRSKPGQGTTFTLLLPPDKTKP